MFDIDNPHQFFKYYDDNDILITHWTMDLVNRNDKQVWIMNHFFVNPTANFDNVLTQQMPTAKLIAKESGHPIWPLDPAVINFFKNHPDYYNFWYHKPCNLMDD